MISKSRVNSFFIVFLAATCLFSSCRKKGNNEKLDKGNNESSSELIPATTGSWWLMKADDNSVSKTTATGIDSAVGGGQYDYFEMKDTSTGYITPKFYAKNTDYYLNLIDLSDGDGQYVAAIICTVDPKAGDTWTNTSQMQYSGMTVDVKTEGKVTEVDGTLTINGHTYTNVIHTKNELKGKVHGTPVWINCGELNMDIKPGVGILKSDLDVHILSFFQKQISNSLLDYHIEE